MKDLKDKEIIIGLILIIILGVIALFLIIRRETGYKTVQEPVVIENISMEEKADEEWGEGTVTEEFFEEETFIDSDPVIEDVEEQSVEEKSVEEKNNTIANVQVITQKNSEDVSQGANIGLYDILGDELYTQTTLTDRKVNDDQLKELFEYWDDYKLEAVSDLVRLERIQKISDELEGTRHFYYYGSVDRLGRPSGKGLAIYANNTFYCGEWKEGLRSGKGMWLQVAIYDNKNENLGVIEHSYNGQWSKDLPNGQGQEHFSYDYDILKEESMEQNICIANVIGNFKDGYYHGDMYIMTVDEDGNTRDWNGTCENGVWEPIMKGNTTDAVWTALEKDEYGNEIHHHMFPKENKDYGILGLKKQLP